MKSLIYKCIPLVFVAVLALGVSQRALAEDVSVDASSTVSPAISPSTTDGKPNIRARVENRIEKNREIRNNTLEKRKEIRKEIKKEAKEDIKDLKINTRNNLKMIQASTSNMFKRTNINKKEILKRMGARKFEARKNALINNLRITLNNLGNIESRIEDRIVKVEQNGRNLADARVLLSVAKEKIAKAKVDVDALESTFATEVKTEGEVDLEKPRTVGDTAIKSVREARDALKKVVEAIAKAMKVGEKESKNLNTN